MQCEFWVLNDFLKKFAKEAETELLMLKEAEC